MIKDEVLKEWGLRIESDDNDVFEFLNKKYPERCYFIDTFPAAINNSEKFYQVELYHQNVRDKIIPKNIFEAEEHKFIEVIKKLWLYNKVLIQTSIDERKRIGIIKATGKNRHSFMKLRKSIKEAKRDVLVLKNVKHVEMFTKLGARGAVYSIMLFSKHKFLIATYNMCFEVYLHDMSSFELLNNIVHTEGLYLRPFSSNIDCQQ